MAEASTPTEVFCCYSHADERWMRKLEIHLSLLKRQGLIALWHNQLIAPDTSWAQAIDQHLEVEQVEFIFYGSLLMSSGKK